MKTLPTRKKQAEAATKALSEEVDSLKIPSKDNITKIMNSIENDNDFSWDDMDNLFDDWDAVCDMAHDILWDDI